MSNHAPEAFPAPLTEAKRTSLARELFTSNFWMSGLAMVKYIPRYFRVKQVDGNAFFPEEKLHEFRDRILRITPANPRQWGTMNVAPMLHHLNLACGGCTLRRCRRVCRELRDRELLRQIWVRLTDTCQVDPDLPSRCRHRSPSSAVHAGESPGAQSVVRVLAGTNEGSSEVKGGSR